MSVTIAADISIVLSIIIILWLLKSFAIIFFIISYHPLFIYIFLETTYRIYFSQSSNPISIKQLPPLHITIFQNQPPQDPTQSPAENNPTSSHP